MARLIKAVQLVDVEKRTEPSKYYVYIINVCYDDGSVTVIYRRYSQFYEFHCKLLDANPAEAGELEDEERIIPYLPGKKLFARTNTRAAAQKRQKAINAYCEELLRLPKRISECKDVQSVRLKCPCSPRLSTGPRHVARSLAPFQRSACIDKCSFCDIKSVFSSSHPFARLVAPPVSEQFFEVNDSDIHVDASDSSKKREEKSDEMQVSEVFMGDEVGRWSPRSWWLVSPHAPPARTHLQPAPCHTVLLMLTGSVTAPASC